MSKEKPNFLVEVLRGTSQVFFMENALTGVLFFVAMAYASYASGVWATTIGAAVGVTIATLTARLLEFTEESIWSGLYGFNGVLIGAALPTFIAPSPHLWVYVVVGSAVSTVVTAAFSATLTAKWDVPGSTGPFVLTGWLMVAGAYSFGGLRVIGDTPVLASDYVQGFSLVPAPFELLEIFFRNIGQVYLLGNWISGVIILVGVFVASIRAGFAATAGSVIAMIVSIAMGGNPDAVRQGLYGFSPVLTAMAVGVIFLSPSTKVIIYAALATVMTVFVQGALDVMVAPAGIPSFTAPYVLAMYLFMAPKKHLLPHPHAPVADHFLMIEPTKVNIVQTSARPAA